MSSFARLGINTQARQAEGENQWDMLGFGLWVLGLGVRDDFFLLS